ncbi:HNH endonuclease [Fibrivirga algicola]|uniref:HNH domain-containing protein n=1 Tax=Fibrivirga algicola TaxID=2950420 RepID=A0ABX0QB53_9BACT|nr:HNH endonuclease [Fibrivirga algicola]NID09530.1 hypothetical protein [Fibrivirga algicola]
MGQTLWIVTGRSEKQKPKLYFLAARLTPSSYKEDDYGDLIFRATGKQLATPVPILDQVLLAALKQATANFIGYAELKDLSVVKSLTSLLDVTTAVEPASTVFYPDEFATDKMHTEGAKKQIYVNVYERDKAAREACIKHWGAKCRVCEMTFEAQYGPVGEGFIHVHHLKPIAKIGQAYRVDPINDLIPVCPNCHAMLHRRDPAYSVIELKAIISQL